MKRILCGLVVCASLIGSALAAGGNKSATGDFTFESPFGGSTHVVFNAILKSDGRVTGYLYAANATEVVEWEIQYVGIVGNRAYLSAYSPDGFQYVFMVEDNGEGHNATDDRAMGTLYFYIFPFPGPPVATTPAFQNFLNLIFGFIGRPVTAGNIQVRG